MNALEPCSEHNLTDCVRCYQKNNAVKLARSITVAEWREPVPLFESVAPTPLSVELLPAKLREFARSVAWVTQTQEDLIVAMIVAALAVCVQKKIRVIRSLDSDWIESLNVWIAASAKSGSRKSEVYGYATEPIEAWQKREIERTEAARVEQANTRRLMLLRKKDLERRVSGDMESIQRQAREITSLEQTIPDEPVRPALMDDEATIEGLEQRYIEHNGRWAFFSDEGGIFEIFAGLFSAGRVNLNIMLKGHNGSTIRLKRQGRETEIKNPALTFGLIIQPGIIENLGKTANFRTTGALARFLYVIPESNIGARDQSVIEKVPDALKQEYAEVLTALLDLPYPKDDESPPLLYLSPDALEAWTRFSQGIEDQLGEGKPLAHIDDWGSKLAGQALRIAGLFHLVEDREAREISLDTINKAIEFANVLVSHAVYAFSTMCNDEVVSDGSAILRFMLRHGGTVSGRDIRQMERFKKSKMWRYSQAMEELAKRSLVRLKPAPPAGRGRKPSEQYELNPAIKKKGVIEKFVEETESGAVVGS